jgi:hypothetical protein
MCNNKREKIYQGYSTIEAPRRKMQFGFMQPKLIKDLKEQFGPVVAGMKVDLKLI